MCPTDLESGIFTVQLRVSPVAPFDIVLPHKYHSVPPSTLQSGEPNITEVDFEFSQPTDI